jgi:hypothetical protein
VRSLDFCFPISPASSERADWPRKKASCISLFDLSNSQIHSEAFWKKYFQSLISLSDLILSLPLIRSCNSIQSQHLMSHRSATCLISIKYPFLSLLPFFFYYSDISKVVHQLQYREDLQTASAAYDRRSGTNKLLCLFCHFSLPSVVHFRSEPLGLGLWDVAQYPFQSFQSANRVC